jgi:hypothetical protein
MARTQSVSRHANHATRDVSCTAVLDVGADTRCRWTRSTCGICSVACRYLRLFADIYVCVASGCCSTVPSDESQLTTHFGIRSLHEDPVQW